MTRPKIVEITVKTELPGGKVQTIHVAPESEALFFTDRGVEEILAVFYKDNKKHKLKYSHALKAFGKQITHKLFNSTKEKNPDQNDPEIILTDKTIKTVWREKNDDGFLVPMLCKRPPCDIE